mgnify:CR=1 FL=1
MGIPYRPYPWTKDLNYVWDVGLLDWVVMTQPTGGGGGGAATIANGADVAEGATTDAAVSTDTTGTVSGKLRGLVKWAYERMPAALGQTTMAASLPVTLASNQSALGVTGPQTDAESRAYQTATGTIDANGESVTLSLNGATGASVGFVSSSFDGTIRFYSSVDGGSTYTEVQAIDPYDGAIVNRALLAINPGTRTWVFALVGGETHVRVTSVSFSSGSLAVTIKANGGTASPLNLTIGPSAPGDYSLPSSGIVMLGRSGAGSTTAKVLQLTNARYEWSYYALVTIAQVPTSNSATITITNDNAASVIICAQNTNRLGGFVTNTSSAVLYVLLENTGTAAATRFTKRLSQWETFEIPKLWIGQIYCIWATDPNDGTAIVTEF